MKFDRPDWLSVSLHDSARRPVEIQYLLDIFRQFGMHLDRVQPTRWYKETYFFRDGVTVFTIPRTKKLAAAMVELRGDFFEAFGDAGIDCALYFIGWGKVSRIDWAWDFVSKVGDYEHYHTLEEFRPKRKQKVEPKGYWLGEDYRETGFVSGISDFRLRVYDKREESGCEDWEIKEWQRVEVVMRGNLSKNQKWSDKEGRITKESVSRVVQGALLRRFELASITFDGECKPAPRARDVTLEQKIEKARTRAVNARRYHLDLLRIRRDIHGISRDRQVDVEAFRGQGFLHSDGDGRDHLRLGSRESDSRSIREQNGFRPGNDRVREEWPLLAGRQDQ